MIVRESDFHKNRIGILTRGVCFHDIVRNTIVVGDMTGIATLNDEVIDREGIVIDGGGFFLLSENDITGSALTTTDAATIGIRIRDIVTGSEEIYNNSITDCIYANLANGTNSVGQEGVRYLCNHLNGNGTDILVSEFPENANSATISPWQSDLGQIGFPDIDYAAGNTFSSNPGEWHISNVGLQTINYLYGSGTGEEPTLLNGLFAIPMLGPSNTCNEIVVDILPEIGDIDQNTLNDWNSMVQSTKDDWLNSKYLYLALIDDGSTTDLISEVESNWSSDIWTLRAKMLNASPYVSATVLYELADPTLSGFPQAVALEIFLANPNVVQDKRFLFYLEDHCDFPGYMIEILNNVTDQSALRAAIEESLLKNHMRYIDFSAQLIRFEIRNESTSISQVISLLDQMESLTAEFTIIDVLLGQNNITAVRERFEAIPDKFHYVRELKSEYSAFDAWLQVAANTNDWSTISPDEQLLLQNLALNLGFTTAGKKAMGVLNTFFQGDYFIPPYYSEGLGETRSFIHRYSEQSEVQFVKVYPNPTSSLLEIKLQQEEMTFKDENIVIIDNEGRTVQTLPVLYGNQQFALDVRNYTNGSYHVQVIMNNRILQTVTINVAH